MCNILISRKKSFLLLVFTFFVICNIKGQLYGDFPYEERFDKQTKPIDISLPVPGNVNYSNSATFTLNGLRLTEAKTQQFGAVFVNNRQFSSVNGIQIEFEYSMYGGNGGADGFTFFLFDASVANPTIGAVGAGLGYSYNRATDDHPGYRNKGLSGAYLGISFDNYGNFKQRRYQGEALVNGINWTSSAFSSINYKSHVTLRGAKGKVINSAISMENTSGLSDGYTGYPVLITQTTSGSLLNNRKGIILNTDGTYSTFSGYSGNFELGSSGYTTDPLNSNYRKAIIKMYPHIDGGFLITVQIQHGSTITTVIDNYHYRTSVNYIENTIVPYGDYWGSTNYAAYSATYNIDASIPQFLKFGFSASTGAYTNYHYIRMVKITLPRAAEAYNDFVQTYSGISTTIDALTNDLGYTDIVSQNQEGNSINLDKSTFKFINNDNVVSTTPYEYNEPGVGVWKYNPTTGLVTFTSLPSFIGTATINYSIKAGKNGELPYADEAYRSLPASITVVVEKAINTHVISNRFIQPTIK
ncbi:hypothetical protein JGH11_01765 [Dysgonomonas sp. Marseille-P4677]|uniref:hypothetical protein n=1 Tax=Dysgonomonas sp. Marseille-P4677 TaxID=2364790 RepID=UPI001912444D|nr:hypothetical protein [Dysgonomonas sp. Marseille-P4677]MBK5719590.1 hypothetical protein [Dysgonomonas sp. Marseille-P4677]